MGLSQPPHSGNSCHMKNTKPGWMPGRERVEDRTGRVSRAIIDSDNAKVRVVLIEQRAEGISDISRLKNFIKTGTTIVIEGSPRGETSYCGRTLGVRIQGSPRAAVTAFPHQTLGTTSQGDTGLKGDDKPAQFTPMLQANNKASQNRSRGIGCRRSET